MKKRRKILFLIPLAGLILSGCDFNPDTFLNDARSFLSEKVVQPVKGLIDQFSGKSGQEEQKPKPEKEDKDQEGGGEQQGGEEQKQKVLQSISLSGQFKQEYEIDEAFDSTGLVVTAAYDDGSSEDVSAQASFSGFDSSKKGEGTVKVSFGGQEAEFTYTVVKTRWTAAEVALFNDHLHGIELPFFDVEGAEVSLGDDGYLHILDEEGENLEVSGTDIPDFAAKFAAADGWDDVSSDYSDFANAPTGSFWVFERSVETDAGLRRISVQFYGYDSDYSLDGKFYLYASDPFNYSFPAAELAAEFESLGLPAFEIPAPEGDGLYFEFSANPYNASNLSYWDQYGYSGLKDYVYSRIYVYGLSDSTFEGYASSLQTAGWSLEAGVSANDWDYYASKTIEGVGIAHFKMAFAGNYSVLHIDQLLEPLPSPVWPAEEISAYFEDNYETEFPVPAFESESASYKAEEYSSTGWFVDGILVTVTGASSEEIAAYTTTTLPTAGWEVSDGLALKAFPDLGGMATLQFVEDGGVFYILIYFGFTPIPTAGFPTEALADAFQTLGVTPFTIVAPDGEGYTYEYSFDDSNANYLSSPDYCYDNMYINNMSREQYDAYILKLKGDGWAGEVAEDSSVTLKKDFNDKQAKIYLKHTESTSYGNYALLRIYYVMTEKPATAFPAEAIAAAFETLGVTPFTIKAPTGNFTYQFAFSQSNLNYLNSPNSCKDSVLIYGQTSAQLEEYAEELRADGWSGTMNSSGDIPMTKHFDAGFTASIKLENWVDYSRDYNKLTIYYIVEPDPAPGWPTDEIAACLPSGLQDVVPEYTGENSGFKVLNDQYGTAVQVNVGEGNESAAITAYQAVLTAAGYIYNQAFGYYISPHNEIAITNPYVGTSGSITIEFQESLLISEFPLAKINDFLSTYGLGFQLSAAVGNDGNGSGYWFKEDMGNSSYAGMRIVFAGDQVDAIKTAINAIIPSSYEWEDEYDCWYQSSTAHEVDLKYSGGVTYLTFWE